MLAERTGAVLDRVNFPEAHVSTNRTDVVGFATVNIAATTHNYALGDTVSQLRMSSTGPETVTGIAGGTQGRVLRVTNVDSIDILSFPHENTGSTAANRFITPDGQTFHLNPGATVDMFYDGESDRWRLLLKEGITRMQWRGVLQTTTGSAAQFLAIGMPDQYAYFVNVWVASFLTTETSNEQQHKEACYIRHSGGNASLQETHDIITASSNVVLVFGATSTSIALYLDPNVANWRHNWAVEVVAVPMDVFV